MAESTAHAHEEEEEDELQAVWQSCVIILGMYAFFLLEYSLHSLTSHSHSHSASISRSNSMEEVSAGLSGTCPLSGKKSLESETDQSDYLLYVI